jgi:hypothetical protein
MNDLGDIIDLFVKIGLTLVPFLGALAFLGFVFGVGRFIKSSGNESELKKSKSIIVWGIVGLFIMFAIWGIISFLRSEFGFGNDVGIPQITLIDVSSNVKYTPE